MVDIYKVTDASVGSTKNGYKIYKLQLNSSILATRLFPLRNLDLHLKHETLFKKYIENNGSLDFLVGKGVWSPTERKVTITRTSWVQPCHTWAHFAQWGGCWYMSTDYLDIKFNLMASIVFFACSRSSEPRPLNTLFASNSACFAISSAPAIADLVGEIRHPLR